MEPLYYSLHFAEFIVAEPESDPPPGEKKFTTGMICRGQTIPPGEVANLRWNAGGVREFHISIRCEEKEIIGNEEIVLELKGWKGSDQIPTSWFFLQDRKWEEFPNGYNNEIKLNISDENSIPGMIGITGTVGPENEIPERIDLHVYQILSGQTIVRTECSTEERASIVKYNRIKYPGVQVRFPDEVVTKEPGAIHPLSICHFIPGNTHCSEIFLDPLDQNGIPDDILLLHGTHDPRLLKPVQNDATAGNSFLLDGNEFDADWHEILMLRQAGEFQIAF